MTTHEVLVAARNLIDREGHLKKDLGGPGRGYCLLGGLCQAHHGTTNWEMGQGALLGAGNLVSDACGGSIPDWNNAEERTKADALALLDRLIVETSPPPADPFAAAPVARASFREPVA